MKLLRLQLLVHLHGAYLDKYMDTQGFHICIRRDTYTPPFTQLCVFRLYPCRSLILKIQEVVHDVQGKKKKKGIRLLSPGVPVQCVHMKNRAICIPLVRMYQQRI